MIYALTLLLTLLQLGDAYLTIRILSNGGRELNPVMRKLFDKFGVKPVFIVKTIAITALGYHLGEQALMVMCAMYVLVIAWNANQK